MVPVPKNPWNVGYWTRDRGHALDSVGLAGRPHDGAGAL